MLDVGFTRREVLGGSAVLSGPATTGSTRQTSALSAITRNPNVAYGAETLPASIRSRFVDNSNGLAMHVLEAGFESKDRPCILSLHGFPELA
jgi:hypothetical protein